MTFPRKRAEPTLLESAETLNADKSTASFSNDAALGPRLSMSPRECTPLKSETHTETRFAANMVPENSRSLRMASWYASVAAESYKMSFRNTLTWSGAENVRGKGGRLRGYGNMFGMKRRKRSRESRGERLRRQHLAWLERANVKHNKRVSGSKDRNKAGIKP